MPAELKGIVISTILIVLTFVFPRARVLTIPFAFVLILVALFWWARIAAERDLEEDES
jgi:hypothetical protein